MVYEPNAFSDYEKALIVNANTQLDAWKLALELGFRKRHGIPNAGLDNSLPLTPRLHYQTLRTSIDSDMSSIIEVRGCLEIRI
jgi:hypothetical protein